MKTNDNHLPDSVREYFARRGYRHFQIEYPDFGGIILYLSKEGIEPEAAYYLSKPSTIEFVTSEELGRVLDLLKGSGIPLRHAFSTSPFSEASHQLAEKQGISLEPQLVKIAQPGDDNAHIKRQPFRLGWPFATGASRSK